MLKGNTCDPIYVTISYTTEVSTRHFDLPAGTTVREARLAIGRRLSLKGRIKHLNDEVVMDTEGLVENTQYKYVEFFDADDLLEQNVRDTAKKGSTEVLHEKALALLYWFANSIRMLNITWQSNKNGFRWCRRPTRLSTRITAGPAKRKLASLVCIFAGFRIPTKITSMMRQRWKGRKIVLTLISVTFGDDLLVC